MEIKAAGLKIKQWIDHARVTYYYFTQNILADLNQRAFVLQIGLEKKMH